MDTKRRQTIRKHTDLEVFQRSFAAAMQIFELSRKFPAEERYSLTDQGRRSSRSVCANLAEAWRLDATKPRSSASFSDSEGEAAETQVWIQFAVACGYLKRDAGREIYAEYDKIIGM
jgi:four helix bundle protein